MQRAVDARPRAAEARPKPSAQPLPRGMVRREPRHEERRVRTEHSQDVSGHFLQHGAEALPQRRCRRPADRQHVDGGGRRDGRGQERNNYQLETAAISKRDAYSQHVSKGGRGDRREQETARVSEGAAYSQHVDITDEHDFYNHYARRSTLDPSQVRGRRRSEYMYRSLVRGTAASVAARDLLSLTEAPHSLRSSLSSPNPLNPSSTEPQTLSAALPSSLQARHQTALELVRLGHMELHDCATRHRMRDEADGEASWQRRQRKCWSSFKLKLLETVDSLELFKGSLKDVEGEHGTGVGSYFRFVRSLMLLNLFLALIMICVLLVPQVVMKPSDFSATLPSNRSHWLPTQEAAANCSAAYVTYMEQEVLKDRSPADYVLDGLQGTGFLEDTVLFYGHYFNRSWTAPGGGTERVYNMGLAYLCAIGAFFLLSLAVIVYFTGKGVREAMVSSEKHFNRYFNLTFSGWDFVLTRQKPVQRRQISIFREFKLGLEEQMRKRRHQGMRTKERCLLMTVRAVINLLVVVMLVGALYLIAYVTQQSGKLTEENKNLNSFVVLLIEFMPSITIAALNMLLPKVFVFMVRFEKYMSETEVKFTLLRSVFLRLSSLGALVYILRQQLYQSCDDDDVTGSVGAAAPGNSSSNIQCGNCKWDLTRCWESYIGQQIYKLVVFDFFIVVLKTFLYEFPRRLLVQKYPRFVLFRVFGQQEFELPLHVLDIVYTQTLCWFGAYFSPLIPAISAVKCLIFFFVKKVTVLRNMVPSSRPYQASKSSFFFMIVLFFAYVLAVIPVGYVIGNFQPSQTCGAFRVYLWYSPPFSAFHMVYAFIDTLPSWLEEVVRAVGSSYVIIPFIIVLCLVILYYLSIASAFDKTAELLKNQLALEGIDKQYLLTRVREALNGAKVHQS